MNNEAREQNWEVKKEDWLSHGYTHGLRDEPVGSKLTNDIHPIFSYELDDLPHLATTKARWGKLTPEEYELLDQPLRLATQWLESAPTSDAICSITYGERRIPPDTPTFQGLPVFEFRKHNLPHGLMRGKAGGVLKQLAKSIMFQATDRDRGMDFGRRSHGVTSPWLSYYPEGVAITDRPAKRGLASILRIHPEYMTMLKEMLDDPWKKQFQVLKLYFEIAVTICHEVMHAINFAIASELLKSYMEMGYDFKKVPFSEPFHQGQRVAELGFFWENHIFGGACNQSMPIRENPMFFSEWPSWMLRDKEAQPERGSPRKMSFKWLVSTYYIQNSLSQEFWDIVRFRHPQDLLALRIRKRIGVKCYIDYKDDDYDKTWDEQAPGNWIEPSGNFCRVPWKEPDPSYCSQLANETLDERRERLDSEQQGLQSRLAEIQTI